MTKDTTVQAAENGQVSEQETRLKAIDGAQRSIEAALASGRASRAEVTKAARESTERALEMVDAAMLADEEADEAHRLTVIAENNAGAGDAKLARKRERAARKNAKKKHGTATKTAKRAYDAIRFSEPNKMGFMRVVLVIFALHIFFYLTFLVLTSRDHMTYDVTTAIDWITVILEGVAFWMFLNRYKVARYFVMGMAVFGMAVNVVDSIAAGDFNLFVVLLNGWFFLFLFFYFAFSKRVRAVLVNDISLHRGEYDEDDFEIPRKGWPFIRNLIIYFIVFSVLGHWMEMAMCQLIIAGVVQGEYDPTNTLLWRDWLYPFPMEGAAVVLIALVLYPLLQWLKKKFSNPILPYVISFIANALMCTVIEFSMGLLVNADLQLWDYRENFGNIMGQVCLQNTMAFGVAASIIAWFVYPMLERWIARIPRDIMNIVFVVVLVFGGIIWSLYIIEPSAEEQAPVAGQSASETPKYSDEAYHLAELASQIDSLESTVASLPDEQRAQAQEQIAQMRDVLAKSMEVEGVETLPSSEELLDYALGQAFGQASSEAA